ncbi:ExbD/TolR family protein [Cognatilysobacter bugurensis]|uniref:Biopolymer transporter ExbD n=1 Tax=Cognatilysobacter bugurensis TaxID=543356 RepID=A0A918T2N0_9GAMM|nr:biopolymer transporter ExbD [Lysobacter bugurensis]GHA87042.1 hypothetical protein GCM10007067_26100 [Lysobacter bugurensis]
MAAYAPQSSERAIAQINITPLVDVMLVLLVIFMIAAPVVTQTLTLNLPAPTVVPNEPPPRALLQVTQAGDFVLDGRTLDARALPVALTALAERRGDTVLEIKAAGDGDYQSFTTALSAARTSGLQHVTFQP